MRDTHSASEQLSRTTAQTSARATFPTATLSGHTGHKKQHSVEEVQLGRTIKKPGQNDLP
eukprot:867306-Prymnesium_polylepis.1